MQLPLDLTSAGFQGILDSHPDGESIECLPHEYAGPLFFRRSVVVEGQNATFWALEGPVVLVEAPCVTLRDLRIEVTADTPQAGGDKDCALIVKPGADPRLENVEVRGAVRGLRTEEGAWQYPYSLNLGSMLPGQQYEFLLQVVVPVQCQISSQVSGIDPLPAILAPGRNEIRLKLSSLSKDSLVCGSLCLRTALLKRRITVVGRVLPGASGDGDATAISGSILWTPADWGSPRSPTLAPPSREPIQPHQPPMPQPEPPQPQPTTRVEPVVPAPPPAAPEWTPTPTTTRIRKQSTPLSTIWSAPMPTTDKEPASTPKPSLSSAFQPTSPPSVPPSISDAANQTQDAASRLPERAPVRSPRVQRPGPVHIGIFAQKSGEASPQQTDPKDERAAQDSPQRPTEPSENKEGANEAEAPDLEKQTAQTPNADKPKRKPAKPGAVPDVFLKK